MSRRIKLGKLQVKVASCSCVSRYQDEKYGAGQRVHNPRQSKKYQGQYRCTNCGNVRGLGDASAS